MFLAAIKRIFHVGYSHVPLWSWLVFSIVICWILDKYPRRQFKLPRNVKILGRQVREPRQAQCISKRKEWSAWDFYTSDKTYSTVMIFIAKTEHVCGLVLFYGCFYVYFAVMECFSLKTILEASECTQWPWKGFLLFREPSGKLLPGSFVINFEVIMLVATVPLLLRVLFVVDS